MTEIGTAKFWERVKKTDDCWFWTGGLNNYGYGLLSVSDRRELSHRLSWTMHFGPIPQGLCVLHHCDVPACVNPSHLFLGDNLDNIRDRHSKGRTVIRPAIISRILRQLARSACRNGHVFSTDNTYIRPGEGCRICMTCQRTYQARYRERQRAK